MKRIFKVEKLELEVLIDLLISLYESGIDYVDMSSDNSNPAQDKLIIQTKDSYINPKWQEGDIRDNVFIKGESDDDDDDDDDEDFDKPSSQIEIRKLTDDDINELL